MLLRLSKMLSAVLRMFGFVAIMLQPFQRQYKMAWDEDHPKGVAGERGAQYPKGRRAGAAE